MTCVLTKFKILENKKWLVYILRSQDMPSSNLKINSQKLSKAGLSLQFWLSCGAEKKS